MKKSRIAASRSSAEANDLWDSSPSGIPRRRASSAPPHDGRLVATATTSRPRCTRLLRLVPSPETHTPSLTGWSADGHPLGSGLPDDLTDHGLTLRHVLRVHHHDHPESHVEGPPHLVVGDAAPAANLLEDRR